MYASTGMFTTYSALSVCLSRVVFGLGYKRIYTFGIIENPGKYATSLHAERFVFTSSSKRKRDRYRRLGLKIEGKER